MRYRLAGTTQINRSQSALKLLKLFTLIDYIYTSDVKSCIVSGIITNDLSDHLPIFAIIKKIAPQKVYSEKVRKINGINAERFIADLQSQLNSKLNFDQLTSVSLQFELLYETFHAVLEDQAALINPSRKQQQLSKKTWITANIHKLIRKKIICLIKFITKSKHMPALFISNFEIVLIGQ